MKILATIILPAAVEVDVPDAPVNGEDLDVWKNRVLSTLFAAANVIFDSASLRMEVQDCTVPELNGTLNRSHHNDPFPQE